MNANKINLISRFNWIDCGDVYQPHPFIYIKDRSGLVTSQFLSNRAEFRV
jgi:hypothetical protein